MKLVKTIMMALASLIIATTAHAQSITLDSEWEKKAAAEKATNEKAEREKQLKAKADEEAAIKKYNEKLAAEESKKTYAEKHPNMFHSKEGDKDMEETERRNQEEAAKHNWTTLRSGEIWLLMGAHWAESKQALREENWSGTAFRDLPIHLLGVSSGVISFHFRGSYETFYTVAEWIKNK